MEKIKCCKFSFSLLFFFLCLSFSFFLFSYFRFFFSRNIRLHQRSFLSFHAQHLTSDLITCFILFFYDFLIVFFFFSSVLSVAFPSLLLRSACLSLIYFMPSYGHFLFRYSNSCFVWFSFFLYFLLFILIFLNPASVENGGQIQGRKILQHQSSTRLENQHSIPLHLHGIEYRPL